MMCFKFPKARVGAALFVCALGSSAHAIPAFPGAEGFGANTAGGRGGTVYHVTNTNDTGAGSLRTGVGTANRTIVFDVSGTINLASDLKVTKPNITIAGQTAPGDGITLKGRTFSVENTHDVIVRFIRCRPGDINCTNFQGDSFDFLYATNSIADHVTASWSIDECLSPTWSTNITVQWCVIGASLNCNCHVKHCHGYGSLIRYGAGRLSLHHNLYVHNLSRNPRPGDNMHVDFVNNVVYNWGDAAGYNADDTPDNPGGFTNGLNYVNNYFIAGPSTSNNLNTAFDSGVPNAANLEIYQSGNFIDSNKNGLLDGANTGWAMFSSPYTQLASPFTHPPVTTNSAAAAYERVLAFVGASSPRDAVDQQVVNDVRLQTGSIINSQTNQGGWPTLNSTPAPADTDQDGMPDFWELNLGLNPNVANNNHTNADGYTDLEHYLNWLADPHGMGGVNQTINVNLRALAGNNTNLVFTVANATNGAVVLLGDGATAQFLSATNFIGLAGFAFDASNTVDRAAFGPVTVTLLVTNLPPVIVAPPSNSTNYVGTIATFTVTAANAALNYQWRKNDVALTNGGNVFGLTNAMLILSNVAAGDAANYTVVITNFAGSVTSSVATLTVVSNTAPVLGAISNYVIIAGATPTFTNTPSDAEAPPQTLTFSLLNAPAGATVGTNDGVFNWRPTPAQANTTNQMSVVVSDTGTPSLSATQAFSVVVNLPAQPQIQQLAFNNGQFSLTISGDVGPDYLVQASTNLFDWATIFTTNSTAPPSTWAFNWTDATVTNFDQRFYRVLLGP